MIHLHTHSMYSLRDSIIKPDDLVERLREIGQTAVAITDHGSSLGGVSIYKTLKAADIRYIHGVEFYICDDLAIKDKNAKYHHLVALAKNETGRINLNTLISLSEHPENKYFKPRIDWNLLSDHGDGLIILSACLAGELSRAILRNDIDEARRVASRYKARFGDDYYLEIQAHRDEVQIKTNQTILSLAHALDIEPVVTTDAHYTREADRKYQTKYAFGGSYAEDGESYLDCFVQSERQVRDRLNYFPADIVDRCINNTHAIAEKCSLEIPLSAPIMPRVDTPPEFPDNRTWLAKLCADGFREKLNIDLDARIQAAPDRKIFQPLRDEAGNILDYTERDLDQPLIDTYIKRYEYELDCLSRMGFVDYILLVYSYANVAERRGIARGSGGGSLICYLTNITNIDPIEHGLYFERFIDVGALSLLESGEITAKELKIPDIDLDFSGESCDTVLNFLYHKYGADRVASIGKFGTNKTKGTIRDLCRVLDIPLAEADHIAKSFGEYELDEIDAMVAGIVPVAASAKDAITYTKSHTELFDYVRHLIGLPKSFGLHACGKIISTRDLDYFLPSCYDADGIRFLQGDMHDVEDMGLVKIDVLGLRTLDQEYDTLEMSKEPVDFINPKQAYNDERVLDVFRDGDTLGIFQFASNGMKQTLKKMNPSGIDDLAVANALFRPGSMGYIDNFCARKQGRETFEYLHPDLSEILRPTYGIIVFQEQLIEIGRLAGMHNPDLLRKATGKKNPKLLAQVKPELEEKLKARGWSDAQFEKLWTDMLEFAKYSFNKSHASAYAILAYITAKQKAYYPAEFYAGLCNSYIGHSDYVKEEADAIIADARRHKVTVAPFTFRDDHRKCSVKNGRIVYAIPLIRDCNQNTADILYTVRDAEEKFFWRMCTTLISRGMEKSKLKILVSLGFFSEYGNTRELLRVWDILEFFKFGEAKSIKKTNIFDDGFLPHLLSHNSTDRNKDGSESKSYKNINCPAILDTYESEILSRGFDDLDYRVRIANHTEYLGFSMLTTGKEEDRRKLQVRDIFPLKRKKDGKQFGYSIITQSIGSGVEARFTVFNRLYRDAPIEKNDIILCTSFTRDGQYFTLTGYKHLYA